jgi:hypothetical protein
MRFLLRDCQTREFFAGGGRWSTDRGTALAFEHAADAMTAAGPMLRHALEIVISFEDPRFDLKLALTSRSHGVGLGSP